MPKKEKCFVMMPFTTPDLYKDTNHFDKIYNQIFVPAIEKAGYEPYRVDENKICDSIIEKIFDAVQTCSMALCDLSNKNPNVLYELGLRQAYDMPVVLVQDDITERIFDVSGISTVTYKNHRLVENVNEAIEAISEAIIQTKEGKENTLAKIVKAKSANFESIEVTGTDNINIILNTILNDIKDIKNNKIVKDIFSKNSGFSEKDTEVILKHVVLLKQGVTDTYIEKVISKCEYKFGVYSREYVRKNNHVYIEFYYGSNAFSYNSVDELLWKLLGEEL